MVTMYDPGRLIYFFFLLCSRIALHSSLQKNLRSFVRANSFPQYIHTAQAFKAGTDDVRAGLNH